MHFIFVLTTVIIVAVPVVVVVTVPVVAVAVVVVVVVVVAGDRRVVGDKTTFFSFVVKIRIVSEKKDAPQLSSESKKN